jgi:GNAT superfamily N-acetyltransferase
VIRIDRLTEPPGQALVALIAESETCGFGFVRRLADDWSSGANRFDRSGEALFVARVDDDAVGVCGLNVDPYSAAPEVGRVRHLYVLAAHRRRGVGRQLLAAVVAAARGRFATLRLRAGNAEAARFYERLGFRRRADLLHCTHVMAIRDDQGHTLYFGALT